MTMTNPRSLIFGVLRKIITVLSPLYSQDYLSFFSFKKLIHWEKPLSNKIVGQMSKELGRKFLLVKMEKRICLETTSALFAL